MPKSLFNVVVRAMLAIAAIAGVAFGQADSRSSSSLSFEVASIRPSGPLDPAAIMSGKAHLGMSVDRDRVDIGGATLMSLICQAYKVKPHEVAGNPDWLNAGINADRFDILAKMPEGATKDQVPQMLQALLAERFKLVAHFEKRDTPAYALEVGKGGPKLKEAVPDPVAPAPASESAAASSMETSGTGASAAKPATAKGEIAYGSGDNRMTMKRSGNGMEMNSKETGKMRMTPGENGGVRMEADAMSMDSLAASLSQFVDRPVVDMTELKGKYQVSLELSRDTLMTAARKAGMNVGMKAGPAGAPGLPADAASDPSDGSIFASVQQLGLKLERRKLPCNFLVIDHAERAPTEN